MRLAIALGAVVACLAAALVVLVPGRKEDASRTAAGDPTANCPPTPSRRFPCVPPSTDPPAPKGAVPAEPVADLDTPLGDCCSERRRDGSPIDAVVLHSTETADATGESDLLRLAFQLRRKELGAHVANDLDGNSSRLVPDDLMAYHATYWNATTLGIEQIGYAKFTRRAWLASDAQLESTAQWIAHWARRYRIPIRRCEVTGIRYNRRKRVIAGQIVRRGVCSHGELDSRNRSDPGRSYPWVEVLARARAIAEAADRG